MTYYKNDPALTPTVKNFLGKVNKGIPTERMTPKENREAFLKLQNEIPIDMSGVNLVDCRFGGVDCVLVCPPDGDYDHRACIVYVNGGGWVLSGFDANKRFARDICLGAGIPVLCPQYSLSPEAKFPTALEEIRDVVEEVCGKYSKVAIIGNSVGGNMTMVTTQSFVANNPVDRENIKCQCLLWPVADYPDTVKNNSWQKYSKDRYLTAASMWWFWKQYEPHINTATIPEPYLFPAEFNKEELLGIPPTLLVTNENDILRDEGDDLGRNLSQAGVECTSVTFNGMIHDFGVINYLSAIPQTKVLLNMVCSFLRQHLE